MNITGFQFEVAAHCCRVSTAFGGGDFKLHPTPRGPRQDNGFSFRAGNGDIYSSIGSTIIHDQILADQVIISHYLLTAHCQLHPVKDGDALVVGSEVDYYLGQPVVEMEFHVGVSGRAAR